jgi:transcriptional regulator with XRE-family HTH domain
MTGNKTMKKKSLDSLFESVKTKDTYWTSKAILEFTSDLYQLMKQRGLTKADMARALKTSQAYITKVFKGDVNFTIDSMVRLTRALSGKVHIHVVADNVDVRWFDVIKGEKKPVVSWKSNEFEKIISEGSNDVKDPIAA